MKTTFLMVAAMMTAMAQGPGPRVVATIPFPFEVNGVAMAAGRYEVTPAGSGVQMILRNRTAGAAIVTGAAALEAAPEEESMFEFRRYGSKYFLAGVKYRWQSVKLRFAPAKREREIARTVRAEQVERAAE
jgi:hypothetical protein